MAEKTSLQSRTTGFGRRRFVCEAGRTATLICLSTPWQSRDAAQGGLASASENPDAMEQALEMLDGLAQLTNHGPMAAEALVALGHAEAVAAFVESYKKRFTSSYPATRQAITRANWREA